MSSNRVNQKTDSELRTLELIQGIIALAHKLPDTIPDATKEDVICTAMKTTGDTDWETFNRRFDAVFGDDCRDADGRLKYLRRGRLGLTAVCSYLQRVPDQKGMPLDLVNIKLERLLDELKFYVKRSVVLALLPDATEKTDDASINSASVDIVSSNVASSSEKQPGNNNVNALRTSKKAEASKRTAPPMKTPNLDAFLRPPVAGTQEVWSKHFYCILTLVP